MLAFAILAVMLLLFRQRIVMPRLGQVKFSSDRQGKTKRSKIIAMTTLTFTMLVGVIFFALYSTDNMPGWLNTWMGDYFLAAFGGVLAVLVAAAAYVVGVWRYYIYAVLTFAAYITANVLRPDDLEGVPITVAGGIVLLSGMVMLMRFLRKYPLPPQETGGV